MSCGKFPIAVFASGQGTNFQTLADRARDGRLPIEIKLLVSDKPDCGAVQRAKKMGIPVFRAPRSEFQNKDAMEKAIGDELQASGAELIVLAGYMRIIGEDLVAAWHQRMINLHPSLLPSFTGLDAVGQAIDAGVKVTGATVHIVDEGLDTGPIVAQEAFVVPEGATREQIEETLHAVEHDLLAKVVALFAADRICCDGRHIRVIEDSSDHENQQARNVDGREIESIT